MAELQDCQPLKDIGKLRYALSAFRSSPCWFSVSCKSSDLEICRKRPHRHAKTDESGSELKSWEFSSTGDVLLTSSQL